MRHIVYIIRQELRGFETQRNIECKRIIGKQHIKYLTGLLEGIQRYNPKEW